MIEAEQNEICDRLFHKLAETAESIRRGGLLTDQEVTTAFLGIGITLAQHTCGHVAAAEWLRDMADEIERDDIRLKEPLQ